MSLFFPFYEAQRLTSESSRTPCEGFRVMLSQRKRGVCEPLAKTGDWYQQRVGKRGGVLLERDCSKLQVHFTFVITSLSQYWYLRDRNFAFCFREKKMLCALLRCHIHFCCSWDNFIPNSPLPTAAQQLHQERTLHRTKQLLKCHRGLSGNTTTNAPIHRKGPPAAGRQHEDQQSNVPGKKRLRSQGAQASRHTLPALMVLEIPSWTAAPAPTCSSSPHMEKIREHLTPAVCKTQTGGGKYLDKETGVKIPALGNPDFIREVCRNE